MTIRLAYRSIKKNMSNYAVYFVTLIIGTAIFYMFNAIVEQNFIVRIFEGSFEPLTVLYEMMTLFSAVVTVILSFLVMYAGNFLMKRRKREFGIYMLLGMGKIRIAGVIIAETLIAGLASLAAGLFLGIVLSQGMSILLIRMFEADASAFTFFLSASAVWKTLLYFCLIYVCAMLFDLLLVSKQQLVHLFRNKVETRFVLVKSTHMSIVLCLEAAMLLGFIYFCLFQCAYHPEFTDAKGLKVQIWDMRMIILPAIIGIIIGTVLMFRGFSGAVLFGAQRRKKFFLRGIRMFTVRELSSVFRRNMISGSAVCVLLFIAGSIFITCYSVNETANRNLRKFVCADAEVRLSINMDGDAEESSGRKQYKIGEMLWQAGMDPQLLGESVEITVYEALSTEPNILMPGAEQEEYGGYFVKISEYNRLARLYGKETFKLEEDEFLILTKGSLQSEWYDNEYLGKNEIVTLGGKQYHPKYPSCRDGQVGMSEGREDAEMYVVPDSADVTDPEIVECNKLFAAKYRDGQEERAERYFSSGEPEGKLGNDSEDVCVSVYTGEMIRNRTLGPVALLVFLGMYLALVLFITAAAVLSMGELSRAVEAKERYRILRQIGVDGGMIRQSHRIQSAMLFALPFILGAVHSVAGVQAGIWFASEGGNRTVDVDILVSAVVLVLIYVMYYLLTCRCSRMIIEERRGD